VSQIREFDLNGRLLRTYGNYGSSPGFLHGPYDVCLSQNGQYLITAERNNRRVSVFDTTIPATATTAPSPQYPDPSFVRTIGQDGSWPHTFKEVRHVAIFLHDTIIAVSDTGRACVELFHFETGEYCGQLWQKGYCTSATDTATDTATGTGTATGTHTATVAVPSAFVGDGIDTLYICDESVQSIVVMSVSRKQATRVFHLADNCEAHRSMTLSLDHRYLILGCMTQSQSRSGPHPGPGSGPYPALFVYDLIQAYASSDSDCDCDSDCDKRKAKATMSILGPAGRRAIPFTMAVLDCPVEHTQKLVTALIRNVQIVRALWL
jgi:hypothetical protein